MADITVKCYRPLTAWYSREVNPTGKRSLVFTPDKALNRDEEIEVPCGQCIGCRLERSRQWAMRCVHEASLHEDNCFITLTFNDEYLAKRERPKSLDKSEFQRFMKRLRKKFKQKIRYFHCGEYGSQYGRPHYHAILFGLDFPDKELIDVRNGHPLYRSNILEKLWPYGFSSVGSMTFESAAYVARYCLKKVTGDIAMTHYAEIDYETGEILYDRDPEYVTMSRRPGIGRAWYEKYKSDLYPKDFITMNGVKMSVPKFYDKILEQEDNDLYNDLKFERKEKSRIVEQPSRERLDVMEECKNLKIDKKLPRGLT